MKERSRVSCLLVVVYNYWTVCILSLFLSFLSLCVLNNVIFVHRAEISTLRRRRVSTTEINAVIVVVVVVVVDL